jgi:hypothetical protein
LPRIGRQAFDVAALPFGVDRVEGKGGLARSGDAGHDDQRVARHGHVDALEVVLACAADDDLLLACGTVLGRRVGHCFGFRSPVERRAI